MPRKKKSEHKMNSEVKINFVEIDVLPDGKITIADAAILTGYTKRSLLDMKDKLILEQDFPTYVKYNRMIFYYYQDILNWIESKKITKKSLKNKAM